MGTLILGRKYIRRPIIALTVARDVSLVSSLICNFILYARVESYTCFESTNATEYAFPHSIYVTTQRTKDALTENNCDFEDIVSKISVVTFAIGKLKF